MADQLQYIVKFIPDEASLKEVEDALDKIGKAKPKSGTSPFEGVTRDAEQYGEILNSTLRRLVEINDQIKNNQGQIKSLTEASKKNTDEGLKSAQQLALLKAENKELSAEYRTQEAVLNANKVAVDNGTMSYAQMSARMRELKDQMRQIVPDSAENVKALDGMKKEYGTLNTKLKEFDASVGNHQRNVGNYENSLRGLANVLGVIQGPLGPIAGRISAFATVLNRLEEAQDDTKKSTGALVAIKKAFSAVMAVNIPLIRTTEGATKRMGMATLVANSAIKAFNGGLKLFKLALIGTGVGALVVALGGLIAFFKAGEEGSMAFARKMAPLKAIVLVLRDAFAGVGKAIMSAFEDPKQAVIDLFEGIKTNLVNRIKGVGDMFTGLGSIISSAFRLDTDGIKAGIKEMADGIIAFTTGIEDGTDKANEFGKKIADTATQATNLTAQMQAVLLAEREITIARAKQNANMREAMAIARDESKSVQERLRAVEMIAKAEDDMFAREMKNETNRLDILQKQAKLALNSTEENEALVAQEVKLEQLRQTREEKRLTTLETIKMLTAQGGQRELSVLRANLSAQQLASDLQIKMVEDRMIREGKIVELAQMKKDAFEANFIKESKARYDAYFQELRNQFIKEEDAKNMASQRVNDEMAIERLDVDKEVNDATIARAQATSDAQISINKTQAEANLDTQIEMLTRQGRHAEASALIMFKIEQDKKEKIFALKQEFIAKGIQQDEALRLATAQVNADSKKSEESETRRLEDAKFEHKMKMLNAYSSLVTGVGEAIFKDNKAFAVAGAVMDTYGAINRTFKEFGYPKGIPFAAAQALVGFANVKKILATKKGTTGGSASTGSVPQAQAPKTGFGFVEMPSMATQVAGMSNSQSNQPIIILDGEFDNEVLAVKVRQGNNAISSRSIRIG